MEECKSPKYQNFFLTVPDRGTTKEEFEQFIRQFFINKVRKQASVEFLAIVREPFSNPEKGWTHHFHAGLCFSTRVGYKRFWNTCNYHPTFKKLYSGCDFRWPIVAKGKSAKHVFTKYFSNPSKYKRLDEYPNLVIDRPPMPPGGGRWQRLMMYGQGPRMPDMGCTDPQVWEQYKKDMKSFLEYQHWEAQG